MKKMMIALLFAFLFVGCATEVAVQSTPYDSYYDSHWYWTIWYHYPYNYWGYYPYVTVPPPGYYWYRPHYNYYNYYNHHRYNSPMPPPRRHNVTPPPRNDGRKFGNTRQQPPHDRITPPQPPPKQNSTTPARRQSGNTRQTEKKTDGSRTNRR